MTGPIIMVDDEEDLREPTAAYLREQGLDVHEADGGKALDGLLAQVTPALLLLDVTMPGEDGFSIARRMRSRFGDGVGIIMLTARRDIVDRVVGLELGADDYVMKPFDPRELLARLRAVMRRLQAPAPAVAAAPLAASDQASGDDFQDEFWVQTSRGPICVAVDSIDWIEAAKDYALLHTAERSHMIRVTMAALEEKLDPARMMRVHRSAFVRPGAVSGLNQVGRHSMLTLISGGAVRVAPRYINDVSRRMRGR